MAGFGQELKFERERRGMTLEQMCAQTKVKPHHFEALEQEDFRRLPGGVFRRGIMRAYLSSVGLDEPTWMPRFDATYSERFGGLEQSPESQEEAWQQFAENVRRSRNNKREGTGLRWLGVLALFVVLAACGWAFWFYELRFKVAH